MAACNTVCPICSANSRLSSSSRTASASGLPVQPGELPPAYQVTGWSGRSRATSDACHRSRPASFLEALTASASCWENICCGVWSGGRAVHPPCGVFTACTRLGAGFRPPLLMAAASRAICRGPYSPFTISPPPGRRTSGTGCRTSVDVPPGSSFPTRVFAG